jgi:putative transposase
MLVYEYKLEGTKEQYSFIEEGIRIVQFIRNKTLRKWVDGRGVTRNDLQIYCADLAKEFDFAKKLNSMARQASADRAWNAISKFYKNCREHKPGKKGYPTFQHNNRSIEYKTSGWKLEKDGKHITFIDGCNIGKMRLIGTRNIEYFPLKQIKRVRIIRRSDGYYCQFCVEAERFIEHEMTGASIGIDVGLKAFCTDSNGNTIDNPRFYRKAEKKLKKLHRRVSRCEKKSKNRKKAQKKLAKSHLKVQRQRKDFACKQANAFVSSHDLIAYENLKIRNMVKNRKLAKSIHDAGWYQFRVWLQYYGALHDIPVLAVEPQFTSQDCSNCGTRIKKSLSVRTHICTHCGLILDRDENAAKNILKKALDSTIGHMETDMVEVVI